jgi:hypothetical protein
MLNSHLCSFFPPLLADTGQGNIRYGIGRTQVRGETRRDRPCVVSNAVDISGQRLEVASRVVVDVQVRSAKHVYIRICAGESASKFSP